MRARKAVFRLPGQIPSTLTERRNIGRSAALIAATFILSAACAATASRADPLSPTEAKEAFFNLACTRLALTLAANLEDAHRIEIAGWARICSAHPRLSECIDTADLIRGQNKASPLSCGQAVKTGSDVAAAFLPSFDQVCANVTTAWLSGTENLDQIEVAGWVKTCSAHPEVSVCTDANDLIDKNREARPLNCGSNGD